MKKLLLGLFVLMSSFVFSEEDPLANYTATSQVEDYMVKYQYYVFMKAYELCKKNDFRYFFVKEFKIEDNDGQIIEFKSNIKNENGTSFVEKNSNGFISLLCFNEKQDNLLLYDMKSEQIIKDTFSEAEKTTNEKTKSKIISLNTLNELKEEINKNNESVYVIFSSSNCPPCKKLAPLFEKVSSEKSDKFIKVLLDSEESKEFVSEYKIMSVPTLMIFSDNGKKVDKKSGIVEIGEWYLSINNENKKEEK